MRQDYSKIIQTAVNAIFRFGQAATLTNKTGGAFDGVIGKLTGQTETVTPINVLLDSSNTEFKNDENVISSDEIYLAAADVNIIIGDEINFNGKIKKVISVKRIAPSGENILHTLALRS